jgi:outer membrane protein assembly factor BamA
MRVTLLQISVMLCLFFSKQAFSQENYWLKFHVAPTDSIPLGIKPLQPFKLKDSCIAKSYRLPIELKEIGFAAASLDSIWDKGDTVHALIYVGSLFHWGTITVKGDYVSSALMPKRGDLFLPSQIKKIGEDWISLQENSGYPFASYSLDSLQFENTSTVSAKLNFNRGFSYKIDSIHNEGTLKLSKRFLSKYLQLPLGAPYSKLKVDLAGANLSHLPFVNQINFPTVLFTPTGATLNTYLNAKKLNQINALIGFMPSSGGDNKMQLSGEVNLLLTNALGVGETIGFNWQELQKKSPRLNLLYRHPFIFNSPWEFFTSFNLLRKDSSYLNLHWQAGIAKRISTTNSASVFFNSFHSSITEGGLDLTTVLQQHKLPAISDIRNTSFGVEFSSNKTNNLLNPSSGTSFSFMGMGGLKKLIRNNDILNLKDPANPAFSFSSLYDSVAASDFSLRTTVMASKYFPFSKKHQTLKLSVNAGYLQQKNYSFNELFQLGGFKLLRGFDEESQYLRAYSIATIEYRLLTGEKSFFFGFIDGGWGQSSINAMNQGHRYLSGGLGINLETKAGILNLAWASGKKDSSPFDIKASKIHVGYINYF